MSDGTGRAGDVVRTLDTDWEGDDAELFAAVPDWPSWMDKRSSYGPTLSISSYVTRLAGCDYALSQGVEGQVGSPYRLASRIHLDLLTRDGGPDYGGWTWHPLRVIEVPELPEGEPADEVLAGLRRRLPDLLAALDCVDARSAETDGQ